MRGRRRGLNPTKVVFVYILGFFLVCFHQADRLADWFDDLALESEGLSSEIAFLTSAFLREDILPRGPAAMNAAEERLLAKIPRGGLLGHRPEPEPSSPYQAEALIPPPSGFNPGRPDSGAETPGWIEGPPPADSEETRLAALPRGAPALEDNRVFNPARVLLLGDSMMLEGLGPQLQRELKKHEGLVVNRDGEYGTGLVRLDNFDWLAYFDQMLLKYRPDLVIITIGGNDTQDMIQPGQKRIFLGSDDWNRIYIERAADLLRRAAAKGVGVFWVGLPIMGQEPYNSRVIKINALAQEACEAAPNCRFWDSWLSVADGGGNYATFLPDAQGKSVRVRAGDKIHLTEAGGRIMMGKFLADSAAWADYEQKRPGAAELEAAAEERPPAPLASPAATPPEAASPPADGRTTGGPGPAPAPLNQPAETHADDFEDEELEIIEEWPGGLSAPPLTTEPPSPAPSAGGEARPEKYGPAAELREYSFPSVIRGRETAYYLAIPRSGPERPGPFPVVFLLHGAWDGHDAWAKQMGAETLATLADSFGLILVMPDGEPFGWYLDGRETAIESYLIRELRPHVFQSQPLADPRRVGISGLSMGGHGALTLALKHPGLFKAVGAMSAVTDLAAHAGSGHALNHQLNIERVLGPAGREGRNWRGHSARGLTETKPEVLHSVPIILSVGRGDKLTLAENQAYHRLLTDMGIEHVYQESPGGHDWAYWSAQLPIHLDFMADHL